MPKPQSDRLRVVHVVPDMGVGGLPRVVETLCRATDPTRFEVGVLTLDFSGELAAGLQRDGYQAHQLERHADGPDYGAWRRVAAYLKHHRVDIVHSHNTQAWMHGGIGALVARSPRLIHTDHARNFPDRFKYHVYERVLSTWTDRVVGVSDHTTENLHRYEWIPRSKLLTIPNGIDPRPFATPPDRGAVRQALGVPLDAELLILGARLEPQKGISFLLDALHALASRRPRLFLALAGEGSLRVELEAQATRLGVADRVRFLGVRLDLPDLLMSSDLFVLPSEWEGLPMVVLEALAAGCPIVATSVGGVPSAVRHDETGRLVPRRDVAALTDAISSLLDDPESRARFARAGKDLFRRQFSAEAMTRAYERLYLA